MQRKPFKPRRELPLKRERFAMEYLVDFNGQAAAIRSGYSPASADNAACRLLDDARVKALIAKGQAARAARTDVKETEIVQQLRRIAFANLDDFTRKDGEKYVLDMSNCNRDHMAAVQELTEDTTGGTGDGERKQVLRTKIKLSDRVKALELLSRHLGMLHDKTEHSGTISLASESDEALKERLAKLRGE